MELEQNGRYGAFKMIVLMTDGQANWHNGGYDTTAARNHVLSEANAAKALNFPDRHDQPGSRCRCRA